MAAAIGTGIANGVAVAAALPAIKPLKPEVRDLLASNQLKDLDAKIHAKIINVFNLAEEQLEKRKADYKPFSLWNCLRADKGDPQVKRICNFILKNFQNPSYVQADDFATDAVFFALGTLSSKAEMKASINDEIIRDLKVYTAKTGIDYLWRLCPYDWDKFAQNVDRNLVDYLANILVDEEIEYLVFTALGQVKNGLTEEMIRALIKMLPIAEAAIAKVHQEFKEKLQKEHGVHIYGRVPPLKDILELLIPQLGFDAIKKAPAEITPAYVKTKVEALHQEWTLHFIAAILHISDKMFVPEKTLKESELNAQSLGVGICDGVALDHVIKRLANPQAPLATHSAFPLAPKETIGKIAVHPFKVKGNITATMRFLHAAGTVERNKDDPTKPSALLSPAIEAKYKLKCLGKLVPGSAGRNRHLFPMNDLGEMLHSHAEALAKHGNQLVLCLNDGEGNIPSHSVTIQCSAPFHLMDPELGIVEFTSLEELIKGIPLYLSTHYLQYSDLLAFEFAPAG